MRRSPKEFPSEEKQCRLRSNSCCWEKVAVIQQVSQNSENKASFHHRCSGLPPYTTLLFQFTTTMMMLFKSPLLLLLLLAHTTTVTTAFTNNGLQDLLARAFRPIPQLETVTDAFPGRVLDVRLDIGGAAALPPTVTVNNHPCW